MKRGPIARVLLILFFVGLIAVPVVLTRVSAHRKVGHDSAESAISRYGFYLTEVSKQAGINFTHQAPVLDPKLVPIMPEVASMGASVSIVD
ncbi:MAG TPA: hypothetical protein VFL96_03160, partial [Acidobacteriaceae bacterium]|nr:hypothetical protein [Acidobacteriaceae bacterium]